MPELPDEEVAPALLGWTEATAAPQIDEALRHDKVKLIANALGTPPADVIKQIHDSGRLVAALCGAPAQAVRHKDAGVDIIIAQGTEGGGHTGDVGSIVLWPQVIDAVAPTPVLAAGGIGNGRQMAAALALGAQGVWTGSLWLTVEEADTPPAQMQSYLDATSRDTVRSRRWTGKPCRMLRNDWTDAWENPENPKPLGMPLQFMVTGEAVARGHHYAEKAKDVNVQPGRPDRRLDEQGAPDQGPDPGDRGGVPGGHRPPGPPQRRRRRLSRSVHPGPTTCVGHLTRSWRHPRSTASLVGWSTPAAHTV